MRMLQTVLGGYSVGIDEPLGYVKPEEGVVIFAIKIDYSIS